MESSEAGIHRDTYFRDDELSVIESKNPDGLSSGDILSILTGRGFKFSEATLRKYVQLGLLPRSRRVGSKGKHKGSRGLYPAGTIRQINEIKNLMALDCTIEQIRSHFAFVGGEIEELRALIDRILEKLEDGFTHQKPSDLASSDLRQQIETVRSAAEELIRKIENSATRIKKLGQLAREAV
jgi:DNA-binding transcriptional MerR regulator